LTEGANMTIQKGKRYKLKENAWGFAEVVRVISIDKKYILLQGERDKEAMSLTHKTFKELYEEIKDDNQKPAA